MNTKTEYIVIPVFCDKLTQLVKELKAAHGPNLLDAKVSAAMLLSDVLDCAEMTDREREAILGHKLCKQIDKSLDESVQLTIPLEAIPAMAA